MFYWVFVPLVQADLDGFRTWWNQHRVRAQRAKNMPSGHVPSDTFANPGSWGGLDCGIKIPMETIIALRLHLENEGGSRSSHMDFIPTSLTQFIGIVYKTLDLPEIKWTNSWEVFGRLVDALHQLQERHEM